MITAIEDSIASINSILDVDSEGVLKQQRKLQEQQAMVAAMEASAQQKLNEINQSTSQYVDGVKDAKNAFDMAMSNYNEAINKQKEAANEARDKLSSTMDSLNDALEKQADSASTQMTDDLVAQCGENAATDMYNNNMDQAIAQVLSFMGIFGLDNSACSRDGTPKWPDCNNPDLSAALANMPNTYAQCFVINKDTICDALEGCGSAAGCRKKMKLKLSLIQEERSMKTFVKDSQIIQLMNNEHDQLITMVLT